MRFPFLLFIQLLLAFYPSKINSQIFFTPEEIAKEYGDTYMTGVENKKEYMLYVRPFYTKTSGEYIQQKIFFFEVTPSGEKICTRFSILEPSSETKINRDIYNRDLPSVGQDQWFDKSTGIFYKIDEPEGYCMITAWIGDPEPKKIENKLFKI